MPSKFPTDPVRFTTPFSTEHYSLIQVSKAVAADIRQSKTFVIRARPEDNICFCTDTETYRAKEVETTDTLFVTNKIESRTDGESKEYKIKAYLQSFLELTKEEETPYLALKELFKKYVHDGFEGGDVDMSEKITIDDLLEQVQFSEHEIYEGIKMLPIVEKDGFLTFLSRSTRTKLLERLIDLIDDPDIREVTFNRISFKTLRPYYDEIYSDSVINWIVRTYAYPDHSINQKAVCRDRAISFLEKNHEISQMAFERKMIRLLPIGLEMDLTALSGIALFKDSIVHGTLIDYVNVEDLPNDPNERLNLLFKIKDSWTMEEFEPYVLDFCLNKTAVAPFLHKHCQQIREGSVKRFVKKDTDF
uniref:Sister chromatid cohesion protein DCC1 n=1 Tax=Panagrolaimus sp. ES5 TaxID=591445 RepID=A0AC34GUQ1_9BILA